MLLLRVAASHMVCSAVDHQTKTWFHRLSAWVFGISGATGLEGNG